MHETDAQSFHMFCPTASKFYTFIASASLSCDKVAIDKNGLRLNLLSLISLDSYCGNVITEIDVVVNNGSEGDYCKSCENTEMYEIFLTNTKG